MQAAHGDARSFELARWLRLLEQRHSTEIDLDLSRCGAVWQRLGAPRPADRVITVAGTNGKGSTVALISQCLQSLGLRVGQYTSPHLCHFTERLQIQGRQVRERALIAAFEEVEEARGQTSLTYFEFTTLAFLLLMSRSGLDVAVLEVGLGGRLDTVNLVDADLAVITPIGLDHQAFLGDDRLTIGREKAGILRPSIPVILSEERPPSSVLQAARMLDCEMLRAGREFDIVFPRAQTPVFTLGTWQLPLPALQMPGAHMWVNLAGALAAIVTLFPEARKFPEKISESVSRTHLTGRLQSVSGEPEYLLDVGHNPMAAEAIAATLRESSGLICVLAMLEDKDAESVSTRLAPVVKTFVCAGVGDGFRQQSGKDLAARVSRTLPEHDVRSTGQVSDAMELATQLATKSEEGAGKASEKPPKVLVFGSFHTTAQALFWLEDKGIVESA